MVKVVIACTSCDSFPTQNKATGCWYEEVATPYYIFKEKGYEVVIASVEGGPIPFDPASEGEQFATDDVKKFLADQDALNAIKTSPAISSLNPDEVDAVFVAGGHGIVFDGQAPPIADFISNLAKQDKHVSTVCHGACALLGAKTASGEPLVKGLAVTGFSDTEEEAVGLTNAVTYSLQQKLIEQGGKYASIDDWAVHVQQDGKLITGQNPASSGETAQKLVAALEAR